MGDLCCAGYEIGVYEMTDETYDEKQDATYNRVYNLPRPDQTQNMYDMTVGLIVPPSPFVVPPGWEWVHTAPFEGPSIIASLLKGLGYKVVLFDQREDYAPESIREKLKGLAVVGISCFEDNYPYIRQVAAIAKEEDPDRPVILGGPLVSSVPEVMMRDTVADYAVIGEGELTLTELMDYITGNEHAVPIEHIRGLAWKNASGQVIVNDRRTQIQDLDVVPMQDFSVWECCQGKEVPEIYMTYSRGCFANCSFCYRAFPQLRYKSVERVRDEIRFYKQYNFKMVWWSDLTFVMDKEYMHALLDQAFVEHNFRWSCFNRVDRTDEVLYEKMRDRGCDIILYGLESVSAEVLKGYKKGTNKNKIIEALHMTKQARIKCGGLFIVGAPGETRRTLDDLIVFCTEFTEITRVKYLALIPGTQNYRDAVADGTIQDEVKHLEWLAAERSVEEDVDHPGFVKVADHVTKEELKEVYHIINTMIESQPYNYHVSAAERPA